MTDKIKTATAKLGISEVVDVTPLTPFQLEQVEKLIDRLVNERAEIIVKRHINQLVDEALKERGL